MLQNARFESVFAWIVDIERSERGGRFVWMRKPDLRSPTCLIEARGFECANGDVATEDDDRVSFFERIFNDEPTPDIEKQHAGRCDYEQQKNRKNTGHARSPREWRCGSGIE